LAARQHRSILLRDLRRIGIREHALQNVPFQLVVGDREMEAGEVNVRVRGQDKAEGSVKAEAFVERVKGLIESNSPTIK